MRSIVTIVACVVCATFVLQAQDGPYKLVGEIKSARHRSFARWASGS